MADSQTPQTAQQTLAQTVRAKYPGAYDDMDDMTLESKVLAKYPQYSDMPRTKGAPVGTGLLGGPTATMKAAPQAFTLPWLKEKGMQIADPLTQALPAIGATVGGALGAGGGTLAAPGPGTLGGGVTGAVIGGEGGEAGKQLLRRWMGFGDAPQTGWEAGKQIAGQGLGQGAIEAATAGLPFLKGPMQRTAATQYERALAPTTKQNKAITQEIVPELIQRGEYGSLEGLEKRAGQRISQLNPELNTTYQQVSSLPTSMGNLPASLSGSGTKVIQDLEALKQTYMPQGMVAQPQAVNAIEGIQNIVKQYGPDIDASTLRRLRQIFEEAPAKAGAYAGADLSTSYTLNAQQQAADSIRGILNKNPDIGALNKEISFWLDVQRVTSQSGLRRTGQEGGLLKTFWPLASAITGGGAGFAAHSPEAGLGAAAATALTAQTAQIMRSPAWRTMSSVAKDRLASALARGDVGAVSALATRLGVIALQGPEKQPQSTNPAMPRQ
jgi:hypothetical protein